MIRLAREGALVRVTTPVALAAAVGPMIAGRETEALVAIALDRRRGIVDAEILTTGSDAFTVVCVRQILRWALTRKRPASAIALMHNHPSGDPEPSQQDIDVTRRVAIGSRTVDLPLIDHIVIGDGGSFVSLAERGTLDAWGAL